jgi:type IV fimbrial biogenesis protein FimT
MSGVTLVELIITIAVAAILLSLATPGLRSFIASNSVAGLTNELTAALNLARSEAIKRGKTVTICKSSNVTAAVTTSAPACDSSATATWPDGWLVFLDAGTRGTRDGSEDTILKIGQPSTRGAIQTGADLARYVSFFPDGTTTADGTQAARTLTICKAPSQRTIVVSRTGQIKTAKGACS